MDTGLLTAIFAGLGGMIGWGLADFFAKKTIDKLGDITTLFWAQFFGVAPLFIFFLFDPVIPKLGIRSLLILLILGIWSGLSYIPTYIAFRKGKVSLLSPIFASYAVLVTILSALFFNEVIPAERLFGFVTVFIGIILISGGLSDLWLLIAGNESRKDNVKGLKEIFFAVFIFSLWLVSLDRFIIGLNWVPILLAIRIISSLSLFFYSKVKKIDLKIKDNSLWKYLIIIGIFDILAFASVTFGFSNTSHISVVAMLSGAFSLPTIFLARIFLREETTRTQLVGSLIIIIGIVIVSLL